jgi:hypothetical protein
MTITLTREEAQQVHDALLNFENDISDAISDAMFAALTTLRARLAQPEPEPEKCIVRDCENHKHQGRFVGDLCSPCHAFITRNEGKYSQAYRNAQREWQGLTDEEIMSLLPGAVRLPPGWSETVRAIEAKLKEKNNG